MSLMSKGGGFNKAQHWKNKTTDTKLQPAQRLAVTLLLPALHQQAHLARLSDEASTLLSDLSSVIKGLIAPLQHWPLCSKTDFQLWVQDWLPVKAKSASTASTPREKVLG